MQRPMTASMPQHMPCPFLSCSPPAPLPSPLPGAPAGDAGPGLRERLLREPQVHRDLLHLHRVHGAGGWFRGHGGGVRGSPACWMAVAARWHGVPCRASARLTSKRLYMPHPTSPLAATPQGATYRADLADADPQPRLFRRTQTSGFSPDDFVTKQVRMQGLAGQPLRGHMLGHSQPPWGRP